METPAPIGNYRFIEQAAEELATGGGLRMRPDFTETVSALGGSIVRKPADLWELPGSETLTVDGKGAFRVHLPAVRDPAERFLVAVALGHYFLHSKEGALPWEYRRGDPQIAACAAEAVWFALCLLMDRSADSMGDAQAAMKFSVPIQIMALRRKYVVKADS